MPKLLPMLDKLTDQVVRLDSQRWKRWALTILIPVLIAIIVVFYAQTSAEVHQMALIIFEKTILPGIALIIALLANLLVWSFIVKLIVKYLKGYIERNQT